MRQKIFQKHDLDENGNPAGGATRAKGILIDWQNGPLGHGEQLTGPPEPNGAFVEGVILAAIGRLQFYQTASNKRFACRENALAITKLEEALMWLEERTRGREERGVEGEHAMSEARIPRKAVETSIKVHEQQLRAIDAAFETLELLHKEKHDLTEGCMIEGDLEPGVAAGFDMIFDVICLLDARFDPESEVQLRDVVLTMLDKLDRQEKEEPK